MFAGRGRGGGHRRERVVGGGGDDQIDVGPGGRFAPVQRGFGVEFSGEGLGTLGDRVARR